MVAALYIDPRGPYPRLGVDCWGEDRDARTYEGPGPIVAHPPCGPWGRLRHLYRGTEHDCGPRAVAQVHAYSGVLEHPAGSRLWEAVGLPKPGDLWNDYRGFTIEVNQVEWGHACVKPTWLYIVGIAREMIPPAPYPGRQPTHAIWYGKTERAAGLKRLIASKEIRRRTPPAFAQFLIDLASLAVRPA